MGLNEYAGEVFAKYRRMGTTKGGWSEPMMKRYTKPEYRHKGCAKQLMLMLLEDAKVHNLSVVELKATEDGYHLYKSVEFEDSIAEYHNMKIKLI